MRFQFEFRRPRSPYWPAMRYHARRQKRYRLRSDGVEVIEWSSSEKGAAFLMYQSVKGWACARLHIETDGSELDKICLPFG